MPKLNVKFMILIAILAFGPAAQAGILRIERGRVLAIGADVVKNDTVIMTKPGKTIVKDIPKSGVRSMRLRINLASAPKNGSWKLKISGSAGTPPWVYSPAQAGGGAFAWSDDISGSSARVEISSDPQTPPFELAIDRIALAQPHAAPRSITPPDQREDIASQTSDRKQLGKAVARLRFIGDDEITYVCTGFLISADLFITNHHCPQSESEWRSSLIDFDYDSASAKGKTLRFKSFIVSDSERDFAIFRLAEPLKDRQPLSLSVAAPAENSPLLIIEHPGGEPKQVSRLDCRVKGAEVEGTSTMKTDFGHECDTLGGSSGSPVFDPKSQKVVGLHHLGFDGSSTQLVNRAVRIGSIVDFIRQKEPSLIGALNLR
jgi:hypothetical protein